MGFLVGTGIEVQGLLLAAALGICDGSARWSSHEHELVAVVGPGYSLTTGGPPGFQKKFGSRGTIEVEESVRRQILKPLLTHKRKGFFESFKQVIKMIFDMAKKQREQQISDIAAF